MPLPLLRWRRALGRPGENLLVKVECDKGVALLGVEAPGATLLLVVYVETDPTPSLAGVLGRLNGEGVLSGLGGHRGTLLTLGLGSGLQGASGCTAPGARSPGDSAMGRQLRARFSYCAIGAAPGTGALSLPSYLGGIAD